MIIITKIEIIGIRVGLHTSNNCIIRDYNEIGLISLIDRWFLVLKIRYQRISKLLEL